MIAESHLDRTERFIGWLEDQRKASGYTQKELCDAAGKTTSYYCKIVTIRRFREKFGEGTNRAYAPRDFDYYLPYLTALEEKMGVSIAAEAKEVWDGRLPCPPDQLPGTEGLVRLLVRIQSLTPEKRKLVEDLLDHIG